RGERGGVGVCCGGGGGGAAGGEREGEQPAARRPADAEQPNHLPERGAELPPERVVEVGGRDQRERRRDPLEEIPAPVDQAIRDLLADALDGFVTDADREGLRGVLLVRRFRSHGRRESRVSLGRSFPLARNTLPATGRGDAARQTSICRCPCSRRACTNDWS